MICPKYPKRKIPNKWPTKGPFGVVFIASPTWHISSTSDGSRILKRKSKVLNDVADV